MKIEKLNENKIKFTFNNSFLLENNVDIHSFMSNSIENQALFLNLLNKAEKELGFITDNYKLSIDALALNNGTFIITVTRIEKENFKSSRVHANRKNTLINTQPLIYKFSNFDDFCNFKNYLNDFYPEILNNISNNNSLYKYKNFFFFILEESNHPKILFNMISEFGISIPYSELFFQKIKEYGIFITENIFCNT